ncbi:hypothetical protein PENVUL_c038G06646 [Penicillium vulpinum]|uniref:F-box domain-containing protein n=1 Tax=Penicillium vulpinum TaxID=29845 RepID=A0A1V6RLT3_9EURO|nr:hypothetical protein PENVUL_c038G06646 [Penicillium vulpinum]
MAGPLPIFPLEIWFMIFQYLRDEESPQHISRLAQTCKYFHRELEHVIYQPVRLKRIENARRFANTVSSRPDLAALVKEVRHSDDTGFSDFAGYSVPFYQALVKLQNLQTLVMRKTLRPSGDPTPQAALQDLLTEINTDAQDSFVMESCLEDFLMQMESQGYPLGDASDPFSLGFDPCEEGFLINAWAEGLFKYTYFTRSNLKDLIPALRTCHIGANSDFDPYLEGEANQPIVEFNNTIFTLRHLKKLCITGARFREYNLLGETIEIPRTDLKELLLLNCQIDAEELELIVQYPRALERLTIRLPVSLQSAYEEDDYLFFSEELSLHQSKSLEYLDVDIYGGASFGLSLDSFDVLKEVIATHHSMLGSEEGEIVLPHNLERLTIRYEQGTPLPLSFLLEVLEEKILPKLRTILCQIPDNISEGVTSDDVCAEVEVFKSKFKDVGVDLSAELVSYPLTMPKYDLCPCENLAFYHQFPFHPRIEPHPEII